MTNYPDRAIIKSEKEKENKTMKQIYNVQRMTYNDYCNYMGGGYNYNVENLHLEAESPEEAVKMAEEKAVSGNSIIFSPGCEIAGLDVNKMEKVFVRMAKERI